MTVIEGIAFIQQGNPKAAPPSRDQMTAGQKAELTLSAMSGRYAKLKAVAQRPG
jgi:hypothetical protein